MVKRAGGRVVWSIPARRDLAAIWRYLRTEAGRELADERLKAVRRRAEMLRQHAYLGRPRDDIRPGLRGLYAAPYIVFYRVQAGDVQIVRVLHASCDIPAGLAAEE